MSSFGLTLYVLIWPAIAAVVLVVLSVSLVKDLRAARRQGKKMV